MTGIATADRIDATAGTRRGTRVHPGAWWLWALGLAAAAGRTTNPLLLLLVVAVAGYVVAACRSDAPWSRSFGLFLRLGLLVIAIRIGFQVVLGAAYGSTVIVTLPQLALPGWLPGIRLGGPVALEGLLAAAYDGLRLATILVCVGAANSLASPARLLKSVPAAIYELGVSVVVAVSFTPQLVADAERVRTAQRLRGRPSSGLRTLRHTALPVLEGALERSVTLAAAMDSRGYGRSAAASQSSRRLSAGLVLAGLAGACVGAYGLLATDSPLSAVVALMALGIACSLGGMALAGRRSLRTSYRPDPWRGTEWLVAGSGLVVAVALTAMAYAGAPGLDGAVDPPGWPSLPVGAALAVAAGMAPALVAPMAGRRGGRS